MNIPFIKIPFVSASGLKGTPSVFSLEKSYSVPFATVPQVSNINSRVPTGWTQNPLAPSGNAGGYVGNGFNGSNV